MGRHVERMRLPLNDFYRGCRGVENENMDLYFLCQCPSLARLTFSCQLDGVIIYWYQEYSFVYKTFWLVLQCEVVVLLISNPQAGQLFSLIVLPEPNQYGSCVSPMEIAELPLQPNLMGPAVKSRLWSTGFWETISLAILFTLRVFGGKSSERKSPNKYFSYFVLMSDLGFALRPFV